MRNSLSLAIELVEAVLWMSFLGSAFASTLAFAYMYGWLPRDAGVALIEQGIPLGAPGEVVSSTVCFLLIVVLAVAGLAYGLGKLRRRIGGEGR